ncbi:MAG: alkylphosphonate utilization protein [Alphaproteobacteria bacterium]|nr:alkylphosphonate utilization protein [Alphaproteobacteria bacterium]
MSEDDAKVLAAADWGVPKSAWESTGQEASVKAVDCNGTPLNDGDDVTLIKDLEVKGAGVTLKRGTTVKNISLTQNPEEIDCRTKEVKGLVLKTCFVKKL